MKSKDNPNSCSLTEPERLFYEQFTKRQENNNNFLLKLLIIVGSVIILYVNMLIRVDFTDTDKETLLFILIFSESLLMIYFKVIYDEGFAFRRDQIVVYRILRKYKLIANSPEDEVNSNKVFTSDFNPLKNFRLKNDQVQSTKKLHLFWMPAFHNTLATAIFFVHLLIYFSFYIKIRNEEYIVWLIILSLSTSLMMFWIIYRKHQWLKKIYLKELKSNREKKIKKQHP